MQSLVSGASQTSTFSGSSNSISDLQPFLNTVREMNAVENAFEQFRTHLNSMNIEYPEHSLIPRVFSLMETTVGPLVKDRPDLEMEIAESLKVTIETIMPWQKFQSLAAGAGVG